MLPLDFIPPPSPALQVQVLYSQAPSQKLGLVTHSPPPGLRDDLGGAFTWDESVLGAHTTVWSFEPSGTQLAVRCVCLGGGGEGGWPCWMGNLGEGWEVAFTVFGGNDACLH